MRPRFTASSSAGQRDGRRFAVVDTHDVLGGKGMRRVSFHSTHMAAIRAARRMNRNAEAMPTLAEWMEQR